MFGYIKPLECELKVRELALYRAFYCGLCRTIGKRYGVFARALLHFDCTFLACILTQMHLDPACVEFKCAKHPFRREDRYVLPNEMLCYAADVNILLAVSKLEDDWSDERKLSAGALRLLFSRAAGRAKRAQPVLAETIRSCIRQLSEIEKRNASCTDEPSDAFGALMRDIARLAPRPPDYGNAAAEWMFYNLGRWIYLMDAWEDREKDRKRRSYNPFNCSEVSEEEASFLLYVSLNEAEKAYDLINFSGDHAITDNIVRLGCRHATRMLLEKGNRDESI